MCSSPKQQHLTLKIMANSQNILLKILKTSAIAYGLAEGLAEKAAQHRIGARTLDAQARQRSCSSNRACHHASARCVAC